MGIIDVFIGFYYKRLFEECIIKDGILKLGIWFVVKVIEKCFWMWINFEGGEYKLVDIKGMVLVVVSDIFVIFFYC